MAKARESVHPDKDTSTKGISMTSCNYAINLLPNPHLCCSYNDIFTKTELQNKQQNGGAASDQSLPIPVCIADGLGSRDTGLQIHSGDFPRAPARE